MYLASHGMSLVAAVNSEPLICSRDSGLVNRLGAWGWNARGMRIVIHLAIPRQLMVRPFISLCFALSFRDLLPSSQISPLTAKAGTSNNTLT
jgi:hypothetical protein